MTKQQNSNYVDLVISPAQNGQSLGNYRFCTISKNRNQKTINFRLPDEIQQLILDAYSQGKHVRVFA